MFDSDHSVLDPSLILTAAEETTRSLNHLEARKLELACCWADAHGVPADDCTLGGTGQLIFLGGDGTPTVWEFAPADLGAACGESDHQARLMIGDALDLRHRHPVLWRRVLDGEVKAWVARRIVRATRHQSVEIAGEIDRMIAPYADGLSIGRLETIIEAEIIRLNPTEAEANADRAAADQGVWISPSTDHGTRDIFIRTTSAGAAFFDARIDRIAEDLKLCGDTSSKDVRRGTAVGLIGASTLDLSSDPDERVKAQQSASKSVLYVHLTDDAIATNQGVARVEGAGPVTVDQIRRWLGHVRVTVKPVIDLNNQTAVDAYEIPDRLREAVHLINPTDCFPYGVNQTRRQDIDHTIPFADTGPPGQTRIGNLGPLTRRHHRHKTHAGWELKQPFPGIYLWRSPHGRHYLVDHTGTRPLPRAS